MRYVRVMVRSFRFGSPPEDVAATNETKRAAENCAMLYEGRNRDWDVPRLRVPCRLNVVTNISPFGNSAALPRGEKAGGFASRRFRRFAFVGVPVLAARRPLSCTRLCGSQKTLLQTQRALV